MDVALLRQLCNSDVAPFTQRGNFTQNDIVLNNAKQSLFYYVDREMCFFQESTYGDLLQKRFSGKTCF